MACHSVYIQKRKKRVCIAQKSSSLDWVLLEFSVFVFFVVVPPGNKSFSQKYTKILLVLVDATVDISFCILFNV